MVRDWHSVDLEWWKGFQGQEKCCRGTSLAKQAMAMRKGVIKEKVRMQCVVHEVVGANLQF